MDTKEFGLDNKIVRGSGGLEGVAPYSLVIVLSLFDK